MRVLLDTNVLYPAVLRTLLLSLAGQGVFVPLWSPRILAEWAAVAARRGEDAGEGIATVRSRFPEAEVVPPDDPATDLSLPDAGDVHVLAAAIAGRADEIVTANVRDFPSRVLAAHGILRRDPDGFLLEALETREAATRTALAEAHGLAERLSGRTLSPRAVLKRAGLPRLAKRVPGARRPELDAG